MQLNTRIYDSIKFIALIFLPALGALYFGVAQIWGLPNAQEVVGTITITDTFLGALLGLSSASYKRSNDPEAGFLTQVGNDEETGMPHLGLTLNKTPGELLENETITLKVGAPTHRA